MENRENIQIVGEFVSDPNERLNTIYERLWASDSSIARSCSIEGVAQLTSRERTTAYWDFLKQEQLFFSYQQGRKFDYWSANASSAAEVISGLIFYDLHFNVGLNENDEITVEIAISCIGSTAEAPVAVMIGLEPGDTIGWQADSTAAGITN